MIQKWVYLSVLALVGGCASVGDVVVRTEPADAKVFVVDVQTGQSAYLGTSPMSFSKNLPEGKKSDVLQLRLEKDGYESKFASVAAFGAETTYLDLKLSSAIESNQDLRKAFEKNRQLLTDANRFALSKRFSEALVRVEEIISTDPKNDEAFAAKGSLLYLMKDYDGALDAWRKSLELNPSNDNVRSSILDLNLSQKAKQRGPAGSRED